ncbi:pre-mRNA-splicing factor ATP-dependent RNA helicase [Acrasis kona]|uniref:RNA helicase n=1 Tax=Acrasis kona TaxID=1008807 RepID=A0AAW2Z4U6_9EUKA
MAPICELEEEFLELVDQEQTILFIGDSVTRRKIPQFFMNGKYTMQGKCVVCTQTDNLSTKIIAERFSDRMGIVLGEEVGYSTGYENKLGPKNVFNYITEDLLIYEAMSDRDLNRYSVVIIDEAQKSTPSTNILFGLLKQIMKRRTDLKLVIMCNVTVELEKFQKYFDDAPTMKAPSFCHSVEIFYTPYPISDYFTEAIEVVVYIHLHEAPGDILLFLTEDIDVSRACREISTRIAQIGEASKLKVIPLYSESSLRQQKHVLEKAPEGGRKCIVSTDIVELYDNIYGVVYVIDPGFTKAKIYCPRSRKENEFVIPISKSIANQRAQKAGLTAPGKSYRLYTEDSFKNELKEHSYPEILRCNLDLFVLQLKGLGVNNLVYFGYVDCPAPESLMRALAQLYYLKAVDDNVQEDNPTPDADLTRIGKLMTKFPLPPQLSNCLINSPKFGCSSDMCVIAAMLSVPDVFKGYRMSKSLFAHPDGDHLTLLNVYRAFKLQPGRLQKSWCFKHFLNFEALKRADSVRKQLVEIMNINSISPVSNDYNESHFAIDHNNIKNCLISGFFLQIAYLDQSKQYHTLHDNQPASLHPSCTLKNKPQFVLYHKYGLEKEFIKIVTDLGNNAGEILVRIQEDYFTSHNFENTDARKTFRNIAMRTGSRQ